MSIARRVFFFFFFNDTATTEIYTLSLHDALPISRARRLCGGGCLMTAPFPTRRQEEWRYADLDALQPVWEQRSEEHTSELQSQSNLVCRLLLEKKKIKPIRIPRHTTQNPHTAPTA